MQGPAGPDHRDSIPVRVFRAFKRSFSNFKMSVPKLGIAQALLIEAGFFAWIVRLNSRRVWKLTPPQTVHPLSFRPGTSDFEVLRQVFVEEQYGDAIPAGTASATIIDCGANAGYSSAYFLGRYANSRVIAVEPEPSNYELCKANLQAYGDRAKVLAVGVWSSCCDLVIENPLMSREKWSFSLRVARPGEAGVPALDMDALIAASGADAIDLLKIDIEGSEREIFSDPGCHNWIPRVRNIAIELHGQECIDAFHSAMQRYKYDQSESGEITYARNISVLASNS